MMATKRRVAVVTRRDGYANSVKPTHLKRFLVEKGYEVEELDTVGIGRHIWRSTRISIPRITRDCLLLFACEAIWALLRGTIRLANIKPLRFAQGMLLTTLLPLRGAVIAAQLFREHYDVVICESSFDQALFLGRRICEIQILDLPSPIIDELYYGNQLTDSTYRTLDHFQNRCYISADRISFHWNSYQQYVENRSHGDNNWLDCTYGVVPKVKRAHFNASPRIVFLGGLDGLWVNLPLLRHLSQLFPEIDVWGGPDPGRKAGINYLGYAPDLDILANYQFGLVTITDDPLRRMSFSSKQLEYASYGLPTLTPAWRIDPQLSPSSIRYDVESFLETIEHNSNEAVWTAKSERSLALAKTLTWSKALRELGRLLDEFPCP